MKVTYPLSAQVGINICILRLYTYVHTYINIHLSLSLHIQTSTTCLLQILNVCFPIPQMNILYEFGHHTLLVEVPFPLAAIPRFVSLCPLLLLWHFVLVCCYLLLVEDQSGPIGPTLSHLQLGKQTEELSAFVYINNELGMNDHFLASKRNH